MRLLIVTQKVDIDDSVLGFFHGWILEFARHVSLVTVICLFEGKHSFPDNVKILSLGKDQEQSRVMYIARFFRYIVQERNNYDAVFVHMNPIYVVLGGIVWRIFRKTIGLWYTHKSVTILLEIAERFTHVIFTASQESFRLPSRKLRVMGHGIDTSRFADLSSHRTVVPVFRILTIGRMSPVKDYETLVRAGEILHAQHIPFSMTIVGGIADDRHVAYLMQIRNMITEKGLDAFITLTGEVPNTQIEVFLLNADVFVNMSQTGSLDKAALEAMAARIPTVTSNEAVAAVLGEQHRNLVFIQKNPQNLAEVLMAIKNLSVSEHDTIGDSLQMIVKKNHDLSQLIPNILGRFEKVQI